MASGALSFAEILRDEYLYLYGHVPRLRATVEERHLREITPLVLRIEAAPRPLPHASIITRHSLLKPYFENAKGKDDRERLKNAFTQLLETELLEVRDDDRVEHVMLFDALLRDPALADTESPLCLRRPEIIRKLVAVPKARKILFTDRQACSQVVSNDDLLNVFRAQSAAIRLIEAMPDGRAVIGEYPPLLATIADNRRLEQLLSTRKGARQRREQLITTLVNARRQTTWYVGLMPTTRDRFASADGWNIACDPAAVEHAMAIAGDHPLPSFQRSIPLDPLTIFNSMLLEAAFVECFTDSYDVRSMNTASHSQNAAALCLSGGGIRSATFNLGILQGLADHGLLTKFHYLSTVSGGGYIGSWLSSWIRRHPEGVKGVAEDLCAPPADPEEPEVRPIKHLREYSSYLAPKAAAFSADTWSILTTYLRNLLLNWTMLLPALVAILAAPRLIESATFAAWKSGRVAYSAAQWAVVLGAGGLMLVAMLRPSTDKKSGREMSPETIRLKRVISSLWLWPLIGSAVAFCIFWASLRYEPKLIDGKALAELLAAGSAAAGAIYAIRRLFACAAGGHFMAVLRLLKQARYLWPALGEVAATTASGYATGWLLYALFTKLFPPDRLGLFESTLFFEQFVCFAVPIYLLVFFCEATILVGITTNFGTTDHDREWWARSAALMFMVGLAYQLMAVCTVLMPVFVAMIPALVTTSLGGISGVTAWILARSEKLRSRKAQTETSSQLLGVILKIAAATTLVLILALLSLATSYFLAKWNGGKPLSAFKIVNWAASDPARLHLGMLQHASVETVRSLMRNAFLLALAVSLLLDANVYSMHGMYRNRLIRAYLGASRWFRRPDPFTGFDPQDDIAIFELRAEALWPSTFIDFPAFAKVLNNKPDIVNQLPPDVATRLNAFVGSAKLKPPVDEIRSDIVHALNERMVTHDIRHGTPAPPSTTLFTANRRWLEREFNGLITRAPANRKRRPAEQESHSATIEAVAVAETDPRSEQEERVYDELQVLINTRTPERRRPPLHVVSAALNLVGGDNLAWQERKADSFTMSPLHCGNRRLGYRDSYEYAAHISLGTAMAISGAAVSPNRGHSSSPILTFLMTLFNARLGWWLGNPKAWTYKLGGPPSALQSIAAEATGNTNDTSDFVFLSDGGHFDNLGIYEMVRRRCRYIVACDATADGRYAFGDLANAVRKIRIDMGIPITLSTSYLAPEAGQKHGRYCAIGLIHYGDVDHVPHSQRFGHLIYVKPAVYSDCPPDISNYKKDSDQFPHESTVDQFFAESQFESYRVLGRHMIGRICNDQLDARANPVSSIAAFVLWAKSHVDANRKPLGNVPIANMDDVVQWMTKSLNGRPSMR